MRTLLSTIESLALTAKAHSKMSHREKNALEVSSNIYYSMDMVNMANIEEVAKRIGSRINAEAVILFGSYAKGNPDENSDVDFFVIAESELPRFKRSRELYKLFKPYPFGMDILVYTPAEIEKGRKSSLSFVSTVLREGKTVYAGRRNPDSKTMGS